MKRSRALLAAALPATLLAVSLVGCTAAGGGIQTDALGVDCAAPGDGSRSVQVDGEFGGAIELTSSTPVDATDVQRSVLIDGTGEVFAEGQQVTATYTIFNGKTGEVIGNQPDASLVNDEASFTDAAWLGEAVRCGAVDQRAVIVMPVDDALNGSDPATLGFTDLAADDTFIFVFDFTAAQEVCETTVPRDEEFPKVELGENGPTITIPECMEEPTELEITTLVEGDGAVVADGDTVTVNYTGVFWRNGEEFDSSWTRGQPAEFPTDGVIEGFKQALVGQKVGSTVLAVLPSEFGYNDGEVRVFVLEILSTTSGS